VTREGTHAAECRELVALARSAVLSTIAREPAGFPFGSLVLVADDGRGRPLLLLSTLAEHTQNLQASAHASLLVADARAGADPLGAGRVTLLGTCARVGEAEVDTVRARFLAVHPEAARYAGFADFAFYRLEPTSLRFVGGFGRMSWVDAAAYAEAT
jgi:heme iron utilization protein